ncbi:MAG: proton-conducting transporter membrane subunit, partial [Luteolibacter sp.]
MPAYYLEALTVTLGIVLLLVDAIWAPRTKTWIGLAAASGLAVILLLGFIAIGPRENPHAAWAAWPLWNFYQHDSIATFYKTIALVTTMLVILMSIDYLKILSRFTEPAGSEHGIGEFYCLPIFACAGMMWLASARDLAGAFVALELVTISFYIMVSSMRRNVGSLEAGVKYLILAALTTRFIVFG